MEHGKAIEKLNNFEKGWDSLRFIQVLEKLPPSDPFPNLKEARQLLTKGRTLRHEQAHTDGSAREPFDDDTLYSEFICPTRKYVPSINGMDETGKLDLNRRVGQLCRCTPALLAMQSFDEVNFQI